MGLLCGRAGRLTTKNGGFRPGQVFAAMIVDLVTPEMRASGFGTMQAVMSLGPLGAFGLGYWLLSMSITDYTVFWAVAVGLQVGSILWDLVT